MRAASRHATWRAMATIPYRPSDTGESLLELLVWAIETAADDAAQPPPACAQAAQLIDDAGYASEYARVAGDWTARKRQIIEGVVSDVYRETIASAHCTLRDVVAQARLLLDRLETDDPSSDTRARLIASVTRTLHLALSVLPADAAPPRDDLFAGRTEEEVRVLKMAIAIEAGVADWRSAGAPPAGVQATEIRYSCRL